MTINGLKNLKFLLFESWGSIIEIELRQSKGIPNITFASINHRKQKDCEFWKDAPMFTDIFNGSLMKFGRDIV